MCSSALEQREDAREHVLPRCCLGDFLPQAHEVTRRGRREMSLGVTGRHVLRQRVARMLVSVRPASEIAANASGMPKTTRTRVHAALPGSAGEHERAVDVEQHELLSHSLTAELGATSSRSTIPLA